MKKILIPFCLSLSTLYQSQQINFIEYDLPNGLHVILQEDHSTPIITTSVLYHVGSKNEKPGRSGFAHFFEHLMFEGAENYGRGDFFKYISEAGGSNNANTTQDRTYYYETLPSNQLKLSLWLESERMLHAKVDELGINTQREVVKEEKRMRIDNKPYLKAFNVDTFGLLFPTHPYGHAVIGSMDDLNAAQENDFIDFYKTYYVPNNATLTIVGDFEVTLTKQLINEYFGSIPKGQILINRPSIIEQPITQEIIKEVTDPNAQIPAILMAYRTPKQTDRDSYILTMIADLLTSGESSRIKKEIVNTQQLALESGSLLYDLEDYSAFIIYALPMRGKTNEEVVQAIDKEIEKIKKEGISDKELQKLINNLEKDFVETNTSSEGIAEKLANYHVYFHDTNLINNQLSIFQTITNEDIKRVANLYLNTTQRVRVNVQPQNIKND